MSLGGSRLVGWVRGFNVLRAALVIQFLVSIAFNLMGSFFPLFISQELGETLIEATYWTGVLNFVSAFIMAFTAPFWGWLCDRVGTRKILVTVIAGNIVVYTGMTFSTTIAQLLLFRGMQGALGGLSTVMFAILARVASGKELRMALSYQMAAMTVGGLIAPGFGGAIAEFFGYRVALGASTVLFILIVPVAMVIRTPPPETEEATRLSRPEVVGLLPDAVSLVMVYIAISFISPLIPWFLETLGVAEGDLLLYTTVVTILNGAAFAAATPVLTRAGEGKMPFFAVVAAVAIEATAFTASPLVFVALRVVIGSVQAGVPPNLLGGRGGRKGAGIGILNSARFLGMAIGPYLAASILDDGVPPKPFNMLTVMAAFSLASAVTIYLTHRGKRTED